jgi:PAS domain S-box-containing protein
MAPKHELRHWHSQVANAIDMMNCGFMVRARDGRVVYANDCLLDWLGYDREEVEGRPVENLVPPELHEQVRDEIDAISRGDLRVRLAILQRKNSTTFPALVIPQRFTDEAENLLGGFSVIVELGSVQTAKPTGYGDRSGLRAGLERVMLDLQALSLATSLAPEVTISLAHPDLEELSPREQEVLIQLVAGERVPAIAKGLHISPHTVRNHLKAIYRKLGVRSQSELIERVRSYGE